MNGLKAGIEMDAAVAKVFERYGIAMPEGGSVSTDTDVAIEAGKRFGLFKAYHGTLSLGGRYPTWQFLGLHHRSFDVTGPTAAATVCLAILAVDAQGSQAQADMVADALDRMNERTEETEQQ